MKNKPFILFLIITLFSVLIVGGAGVFAFTQGVVSVSTDNLLVDGNMERSGEAFLQGNGAILTKITNNPHSGKQAIRVEANGVSSNIYLQYNTTIGKKYRVTGFARGDGVSSAPRLWDAVGYIWTGTNSTNWQFFDVTYRSTATTLRFYGTADSVAPYTGYGDFDDIVVTEVTTGDIKNPTDNMLADGNMERSGTAYYSSYEGTVITKETTNPHGGRKILRTAYGGTTVHFAYTSALMTVGKKYRLTGYARGDGGSGYPFIRNGGYAYYPFQGTTSNEWQYFDVTFTAGDNELRFYCGTAVDAYSEWDDLTLTEVTTGNISNPNKNLLLDGNMEREGESYWSKGSGARSYKTSTSTPHSGKQAMKMENFGGGAYFGKTIISPGKKYRVTGFYKGNGTSYIRLAMLTGVTQLFYDGTAGSEWKYFDVTFSPTVQTFLAFYVAGTTLLVDDLTLYQVE